MFRSTLVAAVLAAAQGAIANQQTLATVEGYDNNLRFCSSTDSCTTISCVPAKVDDATDKMDVDGAETASHKIVNDVDTNATNKCKVDGDGANRAQDTYAAVLNDAGEVTVLSFTCADAAGTDATDAFTTAGSCTAGTATSHKYFEYFNLSNKFTAAEAKTATNSGLNLCMKQADAAACTALTAANTANCVDVTKTVDGADLKTVVLGGKTYTYTADPEKQVCAAAGDMYFTVIKNGANPDKLRVYTCTAGKYLAADKDGAKADTDGEWSFACGTTASFLKTGAISTSYMTAASFKTDVKGKLSFCSKTAATDCPTGDALKSACSSATTTDDSFTYKEKAYKVVTTAPTVGAACTEHQATIALKSDGMTAGKAGSMNLFECDSSTSKVKTAVAVGDCTKAGADWFTTEDLSSTGSGDSSNSVIVGSAVAASVTVAAALSTF